MDKVNATHAMVLRKGRRVNYVIKKRAMKGTRSASILPPLTAGQASAAAASYPMLDVLPLPPTRQPEQPLFKPRFPHVPSSMNPPVVRSLPAIMMLKTAMRTSLSSGRGKAASTEVPLTAHPVKMAATAATAATAAMAVTAAMPAAATVPPVLPEPRVTGGSVGFSAVPMTARTPAAVSGTAVVGVAAGAGGVAVKPTVSILARDGMAAGTAKGVADKPTASHVAFDGIAAGDTHAPRMATGAATGVAAAAFGSPGVPKTRAAGCSADLVAVPTAVRTEPLMAADGASGGATGPTVVFTAKHEERVSVAGAAAFPAVPRAARAAPHVAHMAASSAESPADDVVEDLVVISSSLVKLPGAFEDDADVIVVCENVRPVCLFYPMAV